MKYIIIGLGNYGHVLAEELSALDTRLLVRILVKVV